MAVSRLPRSQNSMMMLQRTHTPHGHSESSSRDTGNVCTLPSSRHPCRQPLTPSRLYCGEYTGLHALLEQPLDIGA